MAGHQRAADIPAGGGRADIPAGGGQADKGGGALYHGWAYMLALWGKGGHGGSPNVEAGKGVSTPCPSPKAAKPPLIILIFSVPVEYEEAISGCLKKLSLGSYFYVRPRGGVHR
jgi:hypothetical protein